MGFIVFIMKVTQLSAKEHQQFYGTYLAQVDPTLDLMEALKATQAEFEDFLAKVPEQQWSHSYAPTKWNVAQVAQHIIDTERVFQFRALWFSRRETAPLPGFDQDLFAEQAPVQQSNNEALLREYTAVRNASISLLEPMPEAQLKCTGTASGLTWSVAGLGFAICGHQTHHLKQLREKYGLNF